MRVIRPMTNLIERALRYQRIHGTKKFLKEATARILRRLRPPTDPNAAPEPAMAPAVDIGWVSARELAAKQRQQCTPLRLFTSPRPALPRVSIVTDTINKGHLYGGVGTAMILGALLAERRGATLRIITRMDRAQPSGLAGVLAVYGIELSHEVEFAFGPYYDDRYQIDTHEGELFLTTSWWTTASTMASVPNDDIVYLLQEDERMFYPFGDDHLRCSRVLRDPKLRFAINTHLLFDHLVATGLDNVARNAIAFEPAFPRQVFQPRHSAGTGKRTLMFYARPNNVRNLFYFGLEIIEAAIDRGVLDLEEWDVVFVGKDLPKIRLDSGRYSPRRLENLSWAKYAEFASTVDLALCLMYTPHPSYPPFDLSASGAVVVTNRYGNKQDLGGYCRNILCGDLDLDPMLATLAQGIDLARDEQQRGANFREHRLPADWRVSLAPVVDRFGNAG
jgi:O-antigen biosynthesis protein